MHFNEFKTQVVFLYNFNIYLIVYFMIEIRTIKSLGTNLIIQKPYLIK